MEPVITIQGNVGTQPEPQVVGDTTKVSFRIGHTHTFRRNGGSWESAPTVWLTVECWRTLAENVAESVRKGQPVIVVGRLRSQEWTTADGEPRSRMVVDADTVGHDLSRGRGMFNRPLPRAEQDEHSGDSAVNGESVVPEDAALVVPGDPHAPSTVDDFLGQIAVDQETGEVTAMR